MFLLHISDGDWYARFDIAKHGEFNTFWDIIWRARQIFCQKPGGDKSREKEGASPAQPIRILVGFPTWANKK